jgi:AraC-like DNA-binding protein
MKDVAIDSFLNQTRLNLESSAASFERQIDNFKSMHFSMNQIEFYREMRILKELQLRNHYGLLKLQELFRQQCLLLEIPNSSFCLFKRNGSIVTNSRYYTDNMDYFGKKIHVEGLDMEKVLKILYSNRSFLSVYMVSMDEKVPEPYLAYMFQPMNESAIYGMLMSESDILTFFRLNEICPNARLTILNKSGDTLYTNWNGLNDDNFTNIECNINSLNIRIMLGIPNNHINGLIQPITSLNWFFILLAIAMGVIYSIGSAFLHTKPVRKLLEKFPLKTADCPNNEYQALEVNIRSYIDKNQKLQNQINYDRENFRKNLLTRLLVQESYTNADERLVADYLPHLSEECRILCLEFTYSKSVNAEITSSYLLEEIKQIVMNDAILVQMTHSRFVILVKENKDLIHWMSRTVIKINNRIDNRIDNRINNRINTSFSGTSFSGTNFSGNKITLMAGVSETVSSLERLHSAYLHSIFCMRPVGEEPLSIFNTNVKKEIENNQGFQFIHLYRLHNAVLACDSNKAHFYLDTIMKNAKIGIISDRDVLQQLSYAVLLTLSSICNDMEIPVLINNYNLYQTLNSYDCILSYLRNLIDNIIEILDQKRNAPALELHKRVMHYLRENFPDASISIDSIAEYFHVSKTYLYRVIKNITKTSLSEILEGIRMEEARKMLYNTDFSITEIASACGYNSTNTFYKVYKKNFGVSPSVDRKFTVDQNDDMTDDMSDSEEEYTIIE